MRLLSTSCLVCLLEHQRELELLHFVEVRHLLPIVQKNVEINWLLLDVVEIELVITFISFCVQQEIFKGFFFRDFAFSPVVQIRIYIVIGDSYHPERHFEFTLLKYFSVYLIDVLENIEELQLQVPSETIDLQAPEF